MLNRLQLFVLTGLLSLVAMPVLGMEASVGGETGRRGDADKTLVEKSPSPDAVLKDTPSDKRSGAYAKRYPLGNPLGLFPQSPSQPLSIDLLAQNNVTRVTGVETIQTEAGLELILRTVTGSERLVPLILPQGNDLVIDILDATLAFSIRNGVTETNPTSGISRITVNKVDDTSIRVTITGTNQTPSAEIVPGRDDLVLSVTPQDTTAESEPIEEIEVIATGEAEEDGYRVDNATTATRTDTPLRDIPQSIQVVPQQVIEDQNITRIGEALRNVSGVTLQRDRSNASDRFVIRGFEDSRILRNGFRTGSSLGGTISTATSTVERVEVLKGPASVLYGQVEPGGIVNLVTKKPQAEAVFNLEFRAGSFGFIEPSLDFTGPLTEDEKLTYRFNASYQSDGRFQDFADIDILSISPVIRYEFSDATSLTFEYSFLDLEQTYDDGLPIDPVVFDLPKERFLGEPDDVYESTTNSFFLTLDHRFNDSIRVRSGFTAELADLEETAFRPTPGSFDPETNELNRQFVDREFARDNLSWQTDLISEFNTGSVEHQLLAGFELARSDAPESRADVFDPDDRPFTIDVLDPQYDTPIPSSDSRNSVGDFDTTERILGLYLQDLITILPNLKLLVGGRYDFAGFEEEFEITFAGELLSSSTDFDTEAFSPRVGFVYQPIEPISLYGSFSRSFVPNSSSTVDGELIEPERGTQFEIGVRGEFGDLVANLAAYDITKTNITRTDPDNLNFSIPIGEVTSRGVEFDVSGEPISGWNIIASLFFNDAFISEGDEDNPEDDALRNAPGSGASLWTTYEIQQGSLQGLGFGTGLFYAGDREAEIPNDFVLSSYVTVDASLFYNRDNWRAQLNFRNLFDEEFFESSQSTVGIFRGTPFTVVGAVSVEF